MNTTEGKNVVPRCERTSEKHLVGAPGHLRVIGSGFMCKECVSILACAVSMLRSESPMRVARRCVQSPVSTDKPNIHVVPEVGVELVVEVA
jgi:hypothetical protein